MTTNSTRPVERRTGPRNSAPTSTESGGRSPSGPASQRGYCRATYSAKSLRSERCRLRRASERPGSLDAARRTSQRASSATNSSLAWREWIELVAELGDEIAGQALLADAIALE